MKIGACWRAKCRNRFPSSLIEMLAPLDFSIIVPTYDRPAQLDACLRSMRNLRYDRDRFEVIVVDDGGRAPVASIVDRSVSAGLNVHVRVAPHAGPGAARNVGAASARGRFLAFTDDDCLVDPKWLTGLAEALRERPDDLIGGRTVNALPKNPYSVASQLIVDAVYAHFNAAPNRPRFFASNNIGVARARFLAIGGFDEGWKVVACEDRDLCDRWSHHGGQLTYAPAAIIGHAHAHQLWSYCRQYFGHGRGALHYHRLRRQRGSGRLLDDLEFHTNVRNWLVQPFQAAIGVRPVRLAALLGLWQIANATGYAFESVSRRGYRSRDSAVGVESAHVA